MGDCTFCLLIGLYYHMTYEKSLLVVKTGWHKYLIYTAHTCSECQSAYFLLKPQQNNIHVYYKEINAKFH